MLHLLDHPQRDNLSMQRMEASRSAHLRLVHPWRLAPTADAPRYAIRTWRRS